MKKLFLLIASLAATSAFAAEWGYLFVTFKGENEQIYFATSRDGRQWDALNNEQPALVSTVGEKGVRDPFLLRAHSGNKFYILATDLCINCNSDWGRAQNAGSKSIVIWESADLVHWSQPRLAKVAPDDAGCTWAPEAIYDDSKKAYLVFWASKTAGDNFSKQRIWAAWTRDFVVFSKPFIYIDKSSHVIDADIIRENGKYYRFTKDEEYTAINMEVSTNLMGPWSDVDNFSMATIKGYEGPECYAIKPAADGKPAVWCLILDNFVNGSGYKPFMTEDLSSGQFKAGEGFSFPFRFRHGSVLPITTTEYDRLQKTYNQPK